MSQLENMLQHCTVKIMVPSRMGWGTGFFVAPEWILTCAHVVQEAKGQLVRVRWQNQNLEAVVEKSLPDPYDLALLRVTLPIAANPACVYLDEGIKSRDPLYLFGYPDQDFPNGCPVTFNCEGLTGDEPTLIKFALGQVRPGMSGSPLLNQRTGKVCGIVKFTRDRSFDLGGGAIPTRVILEQFPELRELQREFHGGDRRWSSLLPTTTHQGETLDTETVKSYLQSLCQYYEQWWNRYRLTETISARQATFTFKQTVQTEEPSRENLTLKEPIPPSLLQGIMHYVKSEHVLLVGSPGIGKTTALLRLWVVLAEQELQNPKPRIPVLVKLKDYQKPLPSTEDSSGMLTLIKEALEPELSLTIPEIKTLLFQEKRLFLLLDGLNEIPVDIVHSKLADFREKCDRAKIPLVCTARNSSDSLGIQRRLNLQTLSNPEIKRFLRECMSGQEEQVLKLLNKDNRELRKTPFVLWMLYDISKNSDPVPESLGEAFRRFTKSYTGYKINHEGIPVSPEDLEYWNLLLEYLAFEMLRSPDPHNPGLMISERTAASILLQFDRRQSQALLNNLLKYHLLQRPHKGEVSFCHQLIQEYYAAEHLLQQLPTLLEDEDKFKREYLNYWKWTEAIALMLALPEVSQQQAVKTVELALEVDLMLGARLAGAVVSTYQSFCVALINNVKLSKVSKVFFFKKTHFIEIPDWLKINLLEATQSVEAFPSLRELLKSLDPSVRMSTAYAIGRLADKDSEVDLIELQKDPNSQVRHAAKSALWSIESEEVAPKFFFKEIPKLLELRNERIQARTTSKKNQKEEIQLERDRDLAALCRHLNSSDSELRRHAVIEIGKHNFSKALPQLFEMVHDPDVWVRCSVIQVLGELGNANTAPKLLELINDPDSNIVKETCEALGKLGNKVATLALVQVLEENPAFRIRQSAAKALGKLLDQRAIPYLITSLEKDESLDVRWEIAQSLANLGDCRVIPLLSAGLNEPCRDTRVEAIKSLAKLKSPDIQVPALEALKDLDIVVCDIATRIMIEIGDKRAIPQIANLLENSNLDISWTAVEILKKVDISLTAELLPKLTKLLPSDSGKQAFVVIRAIQPRCKYYNHKIWREAIQSQEQAQAKV